MWERGPEAIRFHHGGTDRRERRERRRAERTRGPDVPGRPAGVLHHRGGHEAARVPPQHPRIRHQRRDRGDDRKGLRERRQRPQAHGAQSRTHRVVKTPAPPAADHRPTVSQQSPDKRPTDSRSELQALLQGQSRQTPEPGTGGPESGKTGVRGEQRTQPPRNAQNRHPATVKTSRTQQQNQAENRVRIA